MAVKDYFGRLTGEQIDALPVRMKGVEERMDAMELENSDMVEEDSESAGAGVYAEDITWRGDAEPNSDSLAAHLLVVENALGVANSIADEILL